MREWQARRGLLKPSWEEHARPGHILTVLHAELIHHPPLFIPGQEEVEGDHNRPQNNGEKPGPQDCQPQAGGSQGKVLRVTDPTVESAEGRAAPEEFVKVNLPGADQKNGRPTNEQDRARDPNRFKQQPGGQDHVRQEESRQPARGRPMGEPQKDGIKGRIEKRRKGADHDQHLKGDDEIQDDSGPEESS
jgi:hypothetical protein